MKLVTRVPNFLIFWRPWVPQFPMILGTLPGDPHVFFFGSANFCHHHAINNVGHSISVNLHVGRAKYNTKKKYWGKRHIATASSPPPITVIVKIAISTLEELRSLSQSLFVRLLQVAWICTILKVLVDLAEGGRVLKICYQFVTKSGVHFMG